MPAAGSSPSQRSGESSGADAGPQSRSKGEVGALTAFVESSSSVGLIEASVGVAVEHTSKGSASNGDNKNHIRIMIIKILP